MSAPKVLFYVQHLLGIGHVKRATTLARAMAGEGLDVTVVSGGADIQVIDAGGMDFVQLPPVRASDRNFGGLVDGAGVPVSEALKAERRDILLQCFADLRPDALIIELFPFGRRQLRFELIPLLEAARTAAHQPRVISSVRDILVEKNRPERDAEMVAWARQYFDDILIHGDPSLIPFEQTFPLAADIADMMHYTGYVVEHDKISAAGGDQGLGEVIVSSGSGAVGALLLNTAIGARADSILADYPWRLLAGYSLDEVEFQALIGKAPEGVIVERARPDFIDLLKNCTLSISQGGYNTVMEVLATGARGIAVPYAGGQETEQTLRARLLEARGLIHQIPEGALSPDRLIEKISLAMDGAGPDAPIAIDMDGARKSAALLVQRLGI
ncbi:MAG: glycosyl transferase [Rhodospirillaceae bacterium]|jgi:predicted glycosyltransferase|nr:glycosyl transferase [Rhodospirillaceae bacterium]MBT3886971.1 glycosyl transferase [Rhodospirillaceae bacterium]MBT4116116.1 glycosyl transferase [Rhodospirillaceae bacterium]MBT4673850.1 glycosyl transferase [Rhodospirillaceae bacterium]MBT4719941.1 glycosyl transferase [Rhodospirillaceae bacterium]